MTQVTDSLYQVLVDSYALAIKLQNYHWNVEGRHFKQLHELFEEQYNEVFAVIDDIAERVRTLGAKVPASFSHYAAKQSLTEGDDSLSENAMVKDIYDSQKQVLQTLKAAMDASKAADDEVTLGMVAERIGAHEKQIWMLRSSLPDDVRSELPAAA